VELSVPGHVAFPAAPARGLLVWLRSLARKVGPPNTPF